jgi:hypothetical protein
LRLHDRDLAAGAVGEVLPHRGFRPRWFRKTDYRDFHSNYCGKPEKHTTAQGEITQAEVEAEKVRIEMATARSEKREKERIESEGEKLAAWAQMGADERTELIALLKRKIAHEGDGLTMDYMTEYHRSLEKIAEWEAEIDMYLNDEEGDL